MSDVLQTALKYRDQLNVRIAKVDQFISFGEELKSKHSSEEYTPLLSAGTTPTPLKPQVDEILLKPQVEEPSAPALTAVAEVENTKAESAKAETTKAESAKAETAKAETAEAEAKPAPDKNERHSLFRSALERSKRFEPSEPTELDRRKIGG